MGREVRRPRSAQMRRRGAPVSLSLPGGFSAGPGCSGVRRHAGAVGTAERARTACYPQLQREVGEWPAGGRRAGKELCSRRRGGAAADKLGFGGAGALRLSGRPAGGRTSHGRGWASSAQRVQLPPELQLPRRAPAAAARTRRPSARRRRLRSPPPPPPPLREDESVLHISTSELKGEIEEGGGGQACLRRQTLQACRSQQSNCLQGEPKCEDLGMHCLPPPTPPQAAFYPLPNLGKKKSSQHLTQSLASCLLIHTIRVRIRATASSLTSFDNLIQTNRHERTDHSIFYFTEDKNEYIRVLRPWTSINT